RVLEQQTEKRFNCPATTSTGRVLDAAAALLGICRERTYDGEPSMVLEAYAARGTPQPLEVRIVSGRNGADVLLTSEILREGRAMIKRGVSVPYTAATMQTALAKGIAELALRSAEKTGISTAALSGGVAINRSIRETILAELADAGVRCLTNPRYPFGDGCISCGQVITAGILAKEGKL
ncbi:MAG TPA: carbamoyltransferase HypF, partial [Methanocorpusculum sp.]|nr:carbamoyltransferase HypF [Methanocorpusculum sp.]